jgi:hypothetical protein
MNRHHATVAVMLLTLASSLPAAAAAVGDRGIAPWSKDGVYYPVEIAAKKGGRCRMHWLIPWQHGEYDEWGRCESFVPNPHAKALWRGTWYPVEITGYGNYCYQVHYAGYSDSYDECVTQDRLRW